LVRLSLWVMAALQFWAALSAGARGPVSALILAFLDFFALSARGFPRLRINRFALRLGFTDYIGFRCGTCRDFPVFNLKTREPLRLRERPRIAMDTTLLVPQYMALRPEQAIEWVERLSSTCRRFEGTFSLLWHNTNLVQAWQGRLYLKIMGRWMLFWRMMITRCELLKCESVSHLSCICEATFANYYIWGYNRVYTPICRGLAFGGQMRVPLLTRVTPLNMGARKSCPPIYG
jgi:hypothetical protein